MEEKTVSRASALTRHGALALLVMVLAAGLLIGASRPAPKTDGIQVQLSQLNWGRLGKSFRYPQSRVVEAELSFDSSAASLLVGKGAYANVVIQVPGHRGTQWVVRNLYIRYRDEQAMLGSSPSVQFGLPTRNGERVARLSYLLTVTARPLAAAPVGSLVRTAVPLKNYRVGGLESGTKSAALPLRIGPWQGIKAGKGFDSDIDRVSWVKVPVDDIPPVIEDPNGCAPGAVARSIYYMLDNAGLKPDDVQDIYDDLWDDMGTTIENGTEPDDIVEGKAAYTGRNDLDIDTTLPGGISGIDDAIDTLDDGGDVEILIRWHDEEGNDVGGHVGMIVSIVDNGDGTYTITYIDDEDQDDDEGNNDEHTIIVDGKGNFDGGTIWGLLIENLNDESKPTETPKAGGIH